MLNYTREEIQRARSNLSDLAINKARECEIELGFGFKAVKEAPESFGEIVKLFHICRRTKEAFPVYGEGLGGSLYVTAYSNHCFRFWHDVSHIKNNLRLNTSDECKLAMIQVKEVDKRYGTSSLEHKLFLADTLGQTLYYAIHRKFVENSLTFDLKWIEEN